MVKDFIKCAIRSDSHRINRIHSINLIIWGTRWSNSVSFKFKNSTEPCEMIIFTRWSKLFGIGWGESKGVFLLITEIFYLLMYRSLHRYLRRQGRRGLVNIRMKVPALLFTLVMELPPIMFNHVLSQKPFTEEVSCDEI